MARRLSARTKDSASIFRAFVYYERLFCLVHSVVYNIRLLYKKAIGGLSINIHLASRCK